MNNLLLSFIGFNILNIIDKFTTYFGINQGFVEMNKRASELFNSIGLMQTVFLQVFITLFFSILIYIAFKNFKQKNIKHIVIIPVLFLSIIYFEAVINNVKLLYIGG